MKRKKPNVPLYLAALAITLVIFLTGFIVGDYINEQKLQHIYDLENEIRVQSLGSELALDLLAQDKCDLTNTTTYTQEIGQIGSKLTYMEKIYGFEADQVVNLKTYYSLLLIRHMLINNQVEEECGTGKDSVIYFYTNYGCEDCEDQGLVLSRVHRADPDFLIYSFEFTENNTAVNYLKDKYNISNARLPTLVVNDVPHYGFQSKDRIEEILSVFKE